VAAGVAAGEAAGVALLARLVLPRGRPGRRRGVAAGVVVVAAAAAAAGAGAPNFASAEAAASRRLCSSTSGLSSFSRSAICWRFSSRKSVTGKSLAARLWKRAAYTGLCRGGVHQYAEFLTGFAPNPAQSGADHCVDAEHDALGDHVGPAPVPTLARAPKPGRVFRAAFPRARRVSPANLAAARGANASSSRWGRAPAAPRSVRVPGAP